MIRYTKEYKPNVKEMIQIELYFTQKSSNQSTNGLAKVTFRDVEGNTFSWDECSATRNPLQGQTEYVIKFPLELPYLEKKSQVNIYGNNRSNGAYREEYIFDGKQSVKFIKKNIGFKTALGNRCAVQ